MGDPTKIRQVVMNLISNAIKFTHEGFVKVTCSSTTLVKEGGGKLMVEVAVEDTGIGMDSETQNRVFEAFTQADTSTTREYGGTGLGLAISKHYIETMSGKIQIYSEPDVGTKISFTIPLSLTNPNAHFSKEFSDFSANVLCIDNNCYDMIESHLSRLGIDCSKSELDSEFLDKIDDHHLAIIDLDFLEKNPQLLSDLDKHDSGKIIVTAPLNFSNESIVSRDWKLLTKPIMTENLKEIAGEICHRFREKQSISNLESATVAQRVSRILVAEDVVTNQNIAKEMLQIIGCDVKIASNGKEAIASLSRNHFDLIFMDCQMPVMDGFEATKIIRANEITQSTKRIPIIALTAGISKEDQSKCFSAGMDGLLTKPFTISELRAVIDRSVNKTDSHDTSRDVLNSSPLSHPNQIAAETNSEVMDLNAIGNIQEIENQTGRPILPSLLEGFVSQMNEKIAELTDLTATNNSESVCKVAHAIKSMSANIGAEKVRNLSGNLEAAAKSGETEIELTAEIEIISSAFEEFVQEFRRAFFT
jgi:CheY-like chemotaxis protein/HPt (histidine-containing phosphotransfer) domain-containing protein